MKSINCICVAVLVAFLSTAATPVLLCQAPQAPIIATTYNSHFPAAADGGESFNGIGVSHDGTIYYTIDSPKFNIAGQMYSLNPKTKVVTHIADLSEAVGEAGLKAIPQGKSHVNFVESDGKLYFATHLGYYNSSSGVERTGTPPPGYAPYPGGHFVSYDLKTGKFESLALAPAGEGIISMSMDVERGHLYGITWPTGRFLRYDLKTKKMKDYGGFFEGGEIGTIGGTYRAICRRIVIDPRDGSAYFTTGDGAIHQYRLASDSIETVAGVSLKKDYFGSLDPSRHGMAYNWRAAVWVPSQNAIYGINGASGYLFRFDPSARKVEVLTRLTSEPSQRSGMFDKFEYGYLGLQLGADGHTLYYLTGAPLPDNAHGRGEASHLVTYDIASDKYQDHGEILLDNGDPADAEQALILGQDGTVYTLTHITRDGKRGIDLISFHP
jgi:hypothetical protein